jgi:hypothetical protein
MDRRAVFFLGAAAVGFVLVPFTPSGFGSVGVVLGLTYLLLALLSALDHRSHHGTDRRR